MTNCMPIANWHSLPKVCVPQRICDSLPKFELSAANWRSLSKVCVLQRICDSLLKLSCLQRISTRYRKYVFCFTVESVCFAAN
jgi:hypothetical protein